MAKRTTSFPLALASPALGTPAYRWLYSAIRDQILDGRLRPSSQLPSSRELASLYRLSRGTVVSAFDQLKSEGYVEGTIGSGTRVSKTLPEEWLNVRREELARRSNKASRKRRISSYGTKV